MTAPVTALTALGANGGVQGLGTAANIFFSNGRRTWRTWNRSAMLDCGDSCRGKKCAAIYVRHRLLLGVLFMSKEAAAAGVSNK